MPYQCHNTASPLVSSYSNYYPVGYVDEYSFIVSAVDGRRGVGPSTTHFSSQKFESYLSRYCQVSVDSGSQ